MFNVLLTTPTPISYSLYHRLTEQFDVHPILAENNSSLTLYTTFLNAILVLPTVVPTSIAIDNRGFG